MENSQLCDSIRSNNEHFCFFFFAFFFFWGGGKPTHIFRVSLIFFLFFFFEIFIVTVVFEPFSPQKCVLVQKRHIIVSLSFEVYNEERVQRKVLLLLLLMAEQGPKVGDARSLWNFTPSPGAFLLCCVGVLRVLMIGFLKPILKSQSTSSLFLSLSLSLSLDDDDDFANVPSRRVRLCVLLLLLSFAPLRLVSLSIYIYISTLFDSS